MKKSLEFLTGLATSFTMLFAMFQASLLEMVTIFTIYYCVTFVSVVALMIAVMEISVRTDLLEATEADKTLLIGPLTAVAIILATLVHSAMLPWFFGPDATIYHAIMFTGANICTQLLFTSAWNHVSPPTPA